MTGREFEVFKGQDMDTSNFLPKRREDRGSGSPFWWWFQRKKL